MRRFIHRLKHDRAFRQLMIANFVLIIIAMALLTALLVWA